MQILIFCTLSLKMPIHASKIGVFVGFYPQNGEQYERDPQKAHPWVETRRMTYIRQNQSTCAGSVRANEYSNKILKEYLRKHNRCFFTCSPKPPTLSQLQIDLHVSAYPRRGYIFQVSSKSVQGFRSPRGQNLPFSITLDIGFYKTPVVRWR